MLRLSRRCGSDSAFVAEVVIFLNLTTGTKPGFWRYVAAELRKRFRGVALTDEEAEDLLSALALPFPYSAIILRVLHSVGVQLTPVSIMHLMEVINPRLFRFTRADILQVGFPSIIFVGFSLGIA